MTISGDPTLEALDAVSEALRTIYDAKRNGTATAKDDLRLKKLHVEWMAIMRKIGGGEGEYPSPPRGAGHPLLGRATFRD
jgi:molybdenum cofactor biosynthesis enzyme